MHPTELLIARHGEAHCNRDQIVGGHVGCRGLTDLGRSQVQLLADRFRREHAERPVAALYTSPLRRTRESAQIIAGALGISAIEEADLREQDYGEADGKPWPDVIATFGGVPWQEPHRPLAPGAETWTGYTRRASAALARILEQHAEARVLVVGHGETIDTSFRHLLDLPASTRGGTGFAGHAACLTIWQQVPISWTRPDIGLRWALVRHNDTSHLERCEGARPSCPHHACR